MEFPFENRCYYGICNSYNMGSNALPDMHMYILYIYIYIY